MDLANIISLLTNQKRKVVVMDLRKILNWPVVLIRKKKEKEMFEKKQRKREGSEIANQTFSTNQFQIQSKDNLGPKPRNSELNRTFKIVHLCTNTYLSWICIQICFAKNPFLYLLLFSVLILCLEMSRTRTGRSVVAWLPATFSPSYNDLLIWRMKAK